MYAVLSSGGKQYRVEAGTTLMLERLDGEPGVAGAQVTFDRVLLIGDGDDVTIGTPTVAGASVSATVLGEALGPKLVIFKFKQKVKYRRHTGHRQQLTRVRIDEITQDGKSAKAEAEAVPEAEVKPARRRSRAAETAPDASAKAEARPRRSRATASATEQGASAKKGDAEAEGPAGKKRTATRRSASRKKAEPEE